MSSIYVVPLLDAEPDGDSGESRGPLERWWLSSSMCEYLDRAHTSSVAVFFLSYLCQLLIHVYENLVNSAAELVPSTKSLDLTNAETLDDIWHPGYLTWPLYTRVFHKRVSLASLDTCGACSMSFLEKLQFDGKTIYTFAHRPCSQGLITEQCKGATV